MTQRKLCRNCEYYDCGGKSGPDGRWTHYLGDCLNSLSPRFTTEADNTCDHWMADSTGSLGEGETK